MKTLICSASLLVLLASSAAAQTVTIDFDKDANLGKVSTYAWRTSPETSLEDRSPLAHQRIVKAIEYHLVHGDIREVESDPDIYVTYHAEEREKLHVDVNHWGYGYPSSWRWGHHPGGWNSSATAFTYTEGTLIIDIWDARTKELVWRGTAADIVPRKPEKSAKKIDKAVEKLCRKWQKMKAKGKTAGFIE